MRWSCSRLLYCEAAKYLRLRRQSRESCLLTQAESDSVPADLVAGTDNIFIHFPDHDALMLIDIVNSGWVPIYNCNLSEDIPGYIDAPATALRYPWKTYIGGHLGRLGSREDIELHQAYIADIVESAQGALSTVDPTPYWAKYGQNVWAAVKGYLDAVTDAAAAPVVKKYSGVLGAADVEEFTRSTTFMILQSMRLDQGAGSQVHP